MAEPEKMFLAFFFIVEVQNVWYPSVTIPYQLTLDRRAVAGTDFGHLSHIRYIRSDQSAVAAEMGKV